MEQGLNSIPTHHFLRQIAWVLAACKLILLVSCSSPKNIVPAPETDQQRTVRQTVVALVENPKQCPIIPQERRSLHTQQPSTSLITGRPYETRYDNDILIKGETKFIEEVVEAIELIRQHSPEHYELLKNTNGIAQVDDRLYPGFAYTRFDNNLAQIYMIQFTNKVMEQTGLPQSYRSLLIAIILVHEAEHGRQFETGEVVNFSIEELETKAYQASLAFLETIPNEDLRKKLLQEIIWHRMNVLPLHAPSADMNCNDATQQKVSPRHLIP